MSHLPSLPGDLKNRLLAAGVKDEASLHAALDADPQLHSDYHNWLFTSTIQAFAAVENREALVALSERVPVLTTDEFLGSVQKAIDTALNMGDYDNAEALRQRLNALKEIRAQQAYQRQPPLARAVLAFIQAPDDASAQEVFRNHSTLLDSDEAERMLSTDFDANDSKAMSHLRRRLEMLQRLRRDDK